MITAFLALIAGAILFGITYLGVKLTTNWIRVHKKKKDSKMVIANLGSLMKNVVDSQTSMSLDEIDALEENEDKTVVAEYDEEKDEIIGDVKFVDPEKWMDKKMEIAYNQNNEMLVID